MSPTDADFDDMHHALGRPDGPHVEPYRNRYCCDTNGPQAKRFEALGLWELGCLINDGKAALYGVTDDGIRLTMAWLVARQRAAGLRPWIVSGREMSTRTIIAKTASAARFSVYRDISDVWNCTFREFLDLGVTARAA